MKSSLIGNVFKSWSNGFDSHVICVMHKINEIDTGTGSTMAGYCLLICRLLTESNSSVEQIFLK